VLRAYQYDANAIFHAAILVSFGTGRGAAVIICSPADEPVVFLPNLVDSKPMQKPVIKVMVKAARQGGSVLLRHMSKLDSLSVFEKGRQDYASEVDSQAEVEIIKELRRAFPEVAILAEESGAMGGRGLQTFVIDPLDGTSNYLRGMPHFCVSIALVENGEPTDAVIFDPLRNEIYSASKGAGALLNDKKIRVADRKDLTGSMLITGFPPRERLRLAPQLEATRQLLTTSEAEDIRRTGSAALDLAWVAAGRADGYFEAGREGLGHRGGDSAGARSRRPRLRLPRSRRAAARRRPGHRRQPEGLRRPPERRSSPPATPPRSTEAFGAALVGPFGAVLFCGYAALSAAKQYCPCGPPNASTLRPG
jgi:myo-inositol-1(or 4)-monophosphatase